MAVVDSGHVVVIGLTSVVLDGVARSPMIVVDSGNSVLLGLVVVEKSKDPGLDVVE